MGRKDFGLSYDCLLGLGMTIVVDILKYSGQCPKLIQASAIQVIFERHSSFARMSFQCLQDILSGPGAEWSEHLWIADLNSLLENGFHGLRGLLSISLRMDTFTWRWSALLNDLWRASHRLSNERQGEPLKLIASVAGRFRFLVQFINSQGPRLLLAISRILLSKYERLASLTDALKALQFSQLVDVLYLLMAVLHDCVHHCFECLEILVLFAFLVRAWSMIEPIWLMTRSRFSALLMFDVSMLLRFDITS